MSSGVGQTASSRNDDSSGGQDESSSHEVLTNKKDELAAFYEEWKKEISKQNVLDLPQRNSETTYNEDYEAKARSLFLKGEELEKTGKLYDAIQYYRRAVQLVPDIEFRLEESQKMRPKERLEDNSIANNKSSDGDETIDSESETNDSEDEMSEHCSLLQKVERKINKTNYLCTPAFKLNETHISALPAEIILYILRWVVSSDLDVRSLEMFSQVCRWFYVCARDPRIWKSACERTWGMNCGSLSNNYLSWREMFLERPRLHFNGCYISKTTYIRHGESNFQDQFYRPWHIIAYYRYLRFFPEGIILMLTTPDEPSQCVGLLKNRHPKGSSILTGHYRLKDDVVTIYVHRQEQSSKQQFKRTRRREPVYEKGEQTFHLELKIQNQNRKKHVQLVWTRYSVFTTTKSGVENNCAFDLIGNRFPPLWFSRVKSYSLESENPLM